MRLACGFWSGVAASAPERAVAKLDQVGVKGVVMVPGKEGWTAEEIERVKTVFDAETGMLLGAHMVGAEVTELIQGYVTAKTLKTTEADLIRTIFPHPTISETMHEAVLDAYGRAIHF